LEASAVERAAAADRRAATSAPEQEATVWEVVATVKENDA
jgi:hypothetical protein